MFTQSVKFNTFHYHIVVQMKVQMFEKSDSSNRQSKRIAAPLSKFYGKI